MYMYMHVLHYNNDYMYTCTCDEYMLIEKALQFDSQCKCNVVNLRPLAQVVNMTYT